MRTGRRFGLLRLAIAASIAWATASHPHAGGAAAPDPTESLAQLAEEGGDIYRSRCILCHGNAGGRGPNLFGTKLSKEQFVEIAINGRKGTQMPAFGYVLSPDDVAKVHAFVTSRDQAF
jgi:mono/diheme cytochrome c family protein